jgi:hypothetical protein
LFLVIEDVENLPILDASQFGMRNYRVPARLEQFRGPKEAANLVCPVDRSHAVEF